jgi:hypothetical protein
MGINLSTVNLDGVDPNVAFDPLPAGWYNVVIINTEMKPNGPNAKDPDGKQMEITLQVIDGEHVGRKLFDRLNLVNSNPTATEIAFKTLKAIYNAIGVAKVDDSSQMHGIPLKAKVKLRAKTAEYDANNEIQGYDHISSDHSTGAGVGGTLARGVPGAVSGTPAWAGAAPGNVAPAATGFPGAASPAPVAAPASAPAFAGAPQPWAQPPAAAAPADPMAGARADGWQAHPQHPGYSWRGQDVVSDQELAAHYQPAPPPVAAPAFTPPAGPPAFAGAPAAGAAAPGAPWAAQPPAAAAPAPQFGAPAPATAAGGPTPPWAR